MREFRGQRDLEPKVGAGFVERADRRRTINVALNKMAAEARARGEGQLEVYAAAGARVLEIRPGKRFFQHIEPQCGGRRLSRDGEATAVYRDAVPDADSAPQVPGPRFQSGRRVIRAERSTVPTSSMRPVNMAQESR